MIWLCRRTKNISDAGKAEVLVEHNKEWKVLTHIKTKNISISARHEK